MLASIPSIIRVRATGAVVDVPVHGIVDGNGSTILLSQIRGPRRKLVWGFINRAIVLGLLEKIEKNTSAPQPVDTGRAQQPDAPEPPQAEAPSLDAEPVVSAAAPPPVVESVAVVPTKSSSGLATANLF